MPNDDRLLGEMQAQIATLSDRITSVETEIDRRTESQKDWIEKLEVQNTKTSDAVIRLEGKIKGLERSVDTMRKTANKLVWAILTPVLAAIGLAIMNLIK